MALYAILLVRKLGNKVFTYEVVVLSPSPIEFSIKYADRNGNLLNDG